VTGAKYLLTRCPSGLSKDARNRSLDPAVSSSTDKTVGGCDEEEVY